MGEGGERRRATNREKRRRRHAFPFWERMNATEIIRSYVDEWMNATEIIRSHFGNGQTRAEKSIPILGTDERDRNHPFPFWERMNATAVSRSHFFGGVGAGVAVRFPFSGRALAEAPLYTLFW